MVAVRAERQAAMIFGCLCDNTGSIPSMIGPAVSSSTYNKRASRADALAAGRVEPRPFSTMVETVFPRVLVQCSLLPNFRNAQSAANASWCAATLESATADFQRVESERNGRNAGSSSLAVFSNICAASSYAPLRTFHTYACVNIGALGLGREVGHPYLVHKTIC